MIPSFSFTGWRIAVAIMLVAMTSCRERPNTATMTNSGTMIESFGSYGIGRYRLTVSATKDNLLDYQMTDGANAVVLKSDRRASVYSRWSIYWQNTPELLWLYSGDVGIYVWAKNQNGVFY